jgi:ankyrin repeat protein
MSRDNFQVLHHAVLNRSPEIVRLLMEHGANAREGVYPHRDATSALAIAVERGYDHIVAIMQEVERQRPPSSDEVFRAIAARDDERAIALLTASPALIRAALPVACRSLNERIVAWFLDHGADASARGWRDLTPLDVAAHSSGDDSSAEFEAVAAQLLAHRAELTAAAAVALGDVDWLRTRHAEGLLTNAIEDTGGLLRIAASHNRPEILRLLLDFGFDPDERKRFGKPGGDDVVFTWGMPLWHCAASGRYEMAELLLSRGADPNAMVYASGTPLYQAYGRCDRKMTELLQRHGGRPDATLAGLYRQTELARHLLAGESGDSVTEELLWAGACGGDPEIVQMVLERIDWACDDVRWFNILEQPPRIGSLGESRVGPRHIPRMLPPRARTVRRKPARMNAGSWSIWLDDLAQRRRVARAHDSRRTDRLRDDAAGCGRSARPARTPVEEHAARMGVPVGPCRAGATLPESRRGSGGIGRGLLADSSSVGGKDGARGRIGGIARAGRLNACPTTFRNLFGVIGGSTLVNM